MEFGLRRIAGHLSASIVVTSNPFAKVVGLHKTIILTKVISRPFEINFVFVVAH